MYIDKSIKKIILLLCLVSPLMAQAAFINLGGNLSPANQNGSDPSLITDPAGIVPSNANGTVSILLDTDSNTLDFSLTVDGISQSDLRNFGPNATPIHLHLAGGGNAGNFGPIIIDVSLGTDANNFTDTTTGFEFNLSGISILLDDQEGVQLGMHPGDNLIISSLLSGDAFVLVHTNNTDINGFPFGEIRGNINPVPLPVALPMMIMGLASFGIFVRRSRS
ncbi:MAG: CHRD domain-containing protein [Methylococcaceae bacterium]